FFFARPVRFGLALMAVLIPIGMRDTGRQSLLTERSYFGILNVRRSADWFFDDQKQKNIYYEFTNLTHGTTDHGQNFIKPDRIRDRARFVPEHLKGVLPSANQELYSKENEMDLSRLATTYYHRAGPVGMAMERFDWFQKLGAIRPSEVVDYWNTYKSDARMPASLIGLGAASPGTSTLPIGQLVGAWSEPPYAVIGLGTGTMASYARPFQHMHFYEIDDRVRRYSQPPPGRTLFFCYANDAVERGAELHVLMGDARLRMAQPWVPENMK